MMLAYRKPDLDEDTSVAAKTDKKKKQKEKEKSPVSQHHKTGKKGNVSSSQEQSQESETKKKNKYVNLYSEEGRATSVIKLPGRHHCNCEASKHKLINNCLGCGRIVCSQEGKGPCLFCGNYVCSKQEMEMLLQGSKKALEQKEKLMEGSEEIRLNFLKMCESGDFRAAEAHKNKLLDFDMTCEKRTHVIDDQSDYFCSDSQWLSKDQREKVKAREEELRNKKYGSRRSTTITMDLANKCIIEEKPDTDIYDCSDPILKDFEESNFWNQNVTVNPNISFVPLLVESKPKKPPKRRNSTEELLHTHKLKLQDAQFQSMSDEGVCLSMHQPWASLLVMGIKKDEGRTWFTMHRGRLWIASTKKPAVPETVQQLEGFYRERNRGNPLEFPSHYPSGCLLGCVNVVDCLPQEIYAEKYPRGESENPFVLVCENHVELPLKLPISGKHKIYKMDRDLHKAAKACMFNRNEKIP